MEISQKNYWPKVQLPFIDFLVKDHWIIRLSGGGVEEGVGQLINKSKNNT